MSKVKKVTGVKKAIGDYNRGKNGVIFYNMAHRLIYWEELPEGSTGVTRGPSIVLIGYKIGEKSTGETMDSIKSKVTAHYLAREELGLSTYHYADNLIFNKSSQDDPRVVAYKKYIKILQTTIF